MRSQSRTLFNVSLALLLLALAAPIIATFVGTTGPQISVWGRPEVARALGVSLAASMLAVALASVLGIPAGYAIARSRSRWRFAGLFAIAIPLTLPPVAAGVALLALLGSYGPLAGLLALVGFQFVDNFAGVVAAEFYVCAPFVAIAATAAFADLDVEFEENARSLGADVWTAFFRVALPLAAPGIAAGVLVAWLRALGEYGATSILAYHPASLPIALTVVLAGEGLRPALALTAGFVVLAALVVAVQWAVRRRLI